MLGIIGRLPGLGKFIGLLIGFWRMRNRGFLAWPNISAGRMIVPEKVGRIHPKEIAEEAFQWLQSPRRLQGQKEDLQALRGKAGAVDQMTKQILKLLPNF